MKEFLINILIILVGIVSILTEIIYVSLLDIWDWLKKSNQSDISS